MKKTTIIAIILSVFFLVVGFGIYGISEMNEPEVIVLGNPTDIPSNLQSKLPNAYRWTPNVDEFPIEKLAALNRKIVAPYDKDVPYVLVSLNEHTDMENIMKQANEQRKKAVYVKYEKIDPNIPVSPYMPDWEKLFSLDFVDALADLIVPPAFSNNVPNRFCTTGQTLFSGGSILIFFPDDFPNDGKTTSATYFFHYTSKSCHHNGMAVHLRRNMADWGSHSHNPLSVVSQIDCMKGHNGSGFIKYPINLIANIYKSSCDAGGAPGSCGGCVSGCAQIFSASTPRENPSGSKMWISEPNERNQWNVTRHEIMHNYGYNDTDTANNKENSDHCRTNGHIYF